MTSFFNFSNELKTENDSCFPTLSYKERLLGFATCTFLGYFIQLLSFGSFLGILVGSPEKFAISYSIGNVLAIAGTCFLVGINKQLKNMQDKERLITSIIFVSSLVMTLVCALIFKIAILVLLFLILQFCSYIWYVASYIPFLQSCIKSCLSGVLSAFKK